MSDSGEDPPANAAAHGGLQAHQHHVEEDVLDFEAEEDHPDVRAGEGEGASDGAGEGEAAPGEALSDRGTSGASPAGKEGLPAAEPPEGEVDGDAQEEGEVGEERVGSADGGECRGDGRPAPDKKHEEAEEEELEEGELSDEDEETRKERLKPQPVCRFYSKGQCTWGTSCRFLHPGVLDKGNYNMFSAPKPILPGVAGLDPAPKVKGTEDKPTVDPPPGPTAPPRPETAWERGLRQAKEMKRRSQQRKEVDPEYEEKRTTMSLTQAELEKENDYYARKASPVREDNFSDYEDPFEPPPLMTGRRRIAPPAPPLNEFYRGDRPSSSRPRRRSSEGRGGYDRYGPPSQAPSAPPPPRIGGERMTSSPPPRSSRRRRVAPPRSPPPDEASGRGFGSRPYGRGDEWADPWMRGGTNSGNTREGGPLLSGRDRGSRSTSRGRGGGGGGRKARRSYSSGSSRSSSGSSSSRSGGGVTRRRKKKRSSSDSSSSSSSSRSRSSTPEGIPRRNTTQGQQQQGQKGKVVVKKERRGSSASPPSATGSRAVSGSLIGKNAKSSAGTSAPLQKRLGGLKAHPPVRVKKEPTEERGSAHKTARQLSRRSSNGSHRRRSTRSSSHSSKSPSPPPRKPSSKSVRPLSSNPNKPSVPPVVSMDNPTNLVIASGRAPTASLASRLQQQQNQKSKQVKLTLKSASSTKPVNKVVLEKLGMGNDETVLNVESDSSRKRKPSMDATLEKTGKSAKKEKMEKKDRKTAADRREELLKQLRAVENAIAKKRTKMEDD